MSKSPPTLSSDEQNHKAKQGRLFVVIMFITFVALVFFSISAGVAWGGVQYDFSSWSTERQTVFLRAIGILLSPASVIGLAASVMIQVRAGNEIRFSQEQQRLEFRRQSERDRRIRNIERQELLQDSADNLLKAIWWDTPKHKRSQNYSKEDTIRHVWGMLSPSLQPLNSFSEVLEIFNKITPSLDDTIIAFLGHLERMVLGAHEMQTDTVGYDAVDRFISSNSPETIAMAVLSSLQNANTDQRSFIETKFSEKRSDINFWGTKWASLSVE